MAQLPELPSTALVLFSNLQNGFDASVERDDMERGPAKERVLNSSVVMTQSLSLYFQTLAAADEFESWYFDVIKRIGWFTMLHPYRGTTITTRFIKGDIGQLVPDQHDMGDFRRDTVVEYMR